MNSTAAGGLTYTTAFDAGGALTITITATDTLANYADAIEQIQFSNGAQTPGTINRVFEVVVNDGDDNSNVATSVISVKLDTDDDGVIDEIDIDDDNDGILDTVEEPLGTTNLVSWLQTFNDVITIDNSNIVASGTTLTGGPNLSLSTFNGFYLFNGASTGDLAAAQAGGNWIEGSFTTGNFSATGVDIVAMSHLPLSLIHI